MQDTKSLPQMKTPYAAGFLILPAHNLNLRLDVLGGNRVNGQDLWVYNSNNTSTQRWRIIPNGDGTYRLMPMCAQHENKVIDVESASLANSAPLQLWTWDGISPQMKWIIETGYTLNTPQIGQEQSKWCWAACAQMAARTLVPSSTITQTDIVREIKGTVINKGGTSAECAQGANFAAYNKVYFIALDYPLSEKELLNYLRYDMPVIMCLTTYNSDGTVKSSHDVVAHGYYINWNGELVYQIRNPSPIGSGRSEDMTYEDLIGANGATRWVRTVAQQMIWGQNV